MSSPLAACEARNAILLQTLIGLTEMIRTELTFPDNRLCKSPAWQKALVLADAVIANRPIPA